MSKKLWGAALVAGMLAMTGITAFAIPEKVSLEKAASQGEAKDEEEEQQKEQVQEIEQKRTRKAAASYLKGP